MFIGCSRYPECEHTEQIDKPDETAIACPQCQRGQLVQRRSRLVRLSIPAIATLIASSLSISNR
jgi:ssDNA-binding Zn-finger/Zn-ribbon topoisomerase 1